MFFLKAKLCCACALTWIKKLAKVNVCIKQTLELLTLYIEPQMTTDSHFSYELLPINIIVFLFLCFEQKLKKIERNSAKNYQQNEDYYINL